MDNLGIGILSTLRDHFRGGFTPCGLIIEKVSKSLGVKLDSQNRCSIISRLKILASRGFIQTDYNKVRPSSEDKIPYKITANGLKKLDDELG